MPSPPDTSGRTLRITLVVLVVVMLVAAKSLGVFGALREPALLAKSVRDLGAWGYIAFVVAYALLQPFGLPGTVFVIAAPLLWPWPVAFVLSMTGTMAASTVGFFFARFVARDWVTPRIPERFRKYDDALAHRAFATVFFLRLVFWMPPFLHAFFGVSKVRGWTHFWASLAGYALPLFLMAYFGQRVFDALRAVPLLGWVGVGAVILGVVIWAVVRSRSAMAADASRG